MVSADADAKNAHPSCPLTGANYSFQEIMNILASPLAERKPSLYKVAQTLFRG
jgi:hypothetical protein